MKTVCFFFVSLLACIAVKAQTTNYCGLEKLFTINSGISKQAVIDSIKKNYALYLLNDNIINIPEKAGKNIDDNMEVVIYKIKNSDCFRGDNSKLQFEFVNDKLVKAFIETKFARSDYYDMIDNFNSLRSLLKQEWKHEKQIKTMSGNLVNTGFDYSKAITTGATAEKISLHYINTKPDKGYGVYLLELDWVNTTNNNLESIAY